MSRFSSSLPSCAQKKEEDGTIDGRNRRNGGPVVGFLGGFFSLLRIPKLTQGVRDFEMTPMDVEVQVFLWKVDRNCGFMILLAGRIEPVVMSFINLLSYDSYDWHDL